MYQALRSVGTPTQLVVYPASFHGITRPSYQKDRLERYLAWYAKYVKAQGAGGGGCRAVERQMEAAEKLGKPLAYARGSDLQQPLTSCAVRRAGL